MAAFKQMKTVCEIESETDLRVLTDDLKKQIKEQGRVRVVEV